MAVGITRTVLFETQLSRANKTGHVELQRIDFGPGQASPPHLHPCPVIGVVLSGTVAFQLEGGDLKLLQQGEAFYEPADVPIAHFDNASRTEPMSFLAVYLLERDGEEKLRLLQKGADQQAPSDSS